MHRSIDLFRREFVSPYRQAGLALAAQLKSSNPSVYVENRKESLPPQQVLRYVERVDSVTPSHNVSCELYGPISTNNKFFQCQRWCKMTFSFSQVIFSICPRDIQSMEFTRKVKKKRSKKHAGSLTGIKIQVVMYTVSVLLFRITEYILHCKKCSTTIVQEEIRNFPNHYTCSLKLMNESIILSAMHWNEGKNCK